LMVELHSMAVDAASNVGPVQLGYGLRPYEIRSLVTGRQPTGSRIDGAMVTKAFNALDRDGSGAIDRDEFRGAYPSHSLFAASVVPFATFESCILTVKSAQLR
jgi:hypothetical protein